jgi:hypothetical protein
MNAPVKPSTLATTSLTPLGFGYGGPGPQPHPWVIQGDWISYYGGVTIGAPIGSEQGHGTVNAENVYVDGTDVASMIQVVENHFGAIDCGTF